MKKLLSLPPNLVGCFHDITGLSDTEWFCTNDPVGRKLGSGGGTTWLLQACYEAHGNGRSFDEWLPTVVCCSMPADRAEDCLHTPLRARYSRPFPCSDGSAASACLKTCSPCRCPSISAS